MLIPSIDLVRGRAVQLRHGRELELVADEDPRDLVRRFGRAGEVAVVDLDAARGTGDNLPLIEDLCSLARCRVGGGIRDVERGRRLLRAGARRLIIGTAVDPAFLQEFPATRLIAAVDARDGRVVDRAWERQLDESPLERARRLEPFVGGFLYTAVERKGTQDGVDVPGVEQLVRALEKPVTVAGGVRSLAEVRTLDRMGVDVQAGMALYRGTIGLGESVAAVVDFSALENRVVTVVQDARDGRVLTVAHSTPDTLVETVNTGRVVLDGPRPGRWPANGPSGRAERLVRVEVDCDRDALLFHVETATPACHRGTASCFGDRPFSLAQLEQVIGERARAGQDGSYTARLLTDGVTRRAKVIEEAHELVDADAFAAIRGEAADLLYHVLVDLRARNMPLASVIAELESRRRRPTA